jgi:superfamily II DNA or RNA helicase
MWGVSVLTPRVNAIHYSCGARKMLLHLPTGSGKTIIATLIIERLLPLIDSGKVLSVAYRKDFATPVR